MHAYIPLMSLNSYPENIMPDSEGVEPKAMTIGTNNVFEVGCGILCCNNTHYLCRPTDAKNN